jgi:hypothetical protein
VVRRRGDRQHPADRLDPILFPVIINKANHGLDRRSSSAMAKYADVLRRISGAIASLVIAIRNGLRCLPGSGTKAHLTNSAYLKSRAFTGNPPCNWTPNLEKIPICCAVT